MTNKEMIMDEIKKFPKELRTQMIQKREDELDDAFNQGYQICLIKTLDALLDAKLKENVIIELLQKHFDMRLSEAEDMIRTAKNRRSRKSL